MLASLVGAPACGGERMADVPGAAGDLLAGKSPSRSSGVAGAERMTDAVIASEGDFWRTNVTAVMGSGGEAVWDLGQEQEIACALVQGDNNDFYDLTGSADGQAFAPLWTASPTGRPGMQLRLGRDLTARARYVRLTARGGDGSYSVGELALFAKCPAEWPPRFVAVDGERTDETARARLIFFGVASVLFLFINRKRSRDWVRLLVVVPVGIGVSAFVGLAEMWPLEWVEQTAVRGTVAAVAAAILLREMFFPDRYPAHPKVTAAALVVLATVSLGCYYHFGMPQFRDVSKGRQTLVHPWDMRVYFPVAKYFKELRFDGLYLASVAAHLDNHPGMDPSAVDGVHLRDLQNNQMRTGREVMDEIQVVRQRFSPERWESFKKDMMYFEEVMGPGGYLGSLTDHGGNATPVWILGAHLMFRNAPASELTLTLTALLDPLLMALLFFVVARTYGARVMLILMIAWGTSDFPNFTDSNLMGATLRQDWMVALGLGACALKRGRWALGGGLIAYGGLIRAFPALAGMFLAVPPLWWIIDRARERKKLPGLKEIWQAQGPALRAIAGGVGTMVVLVALSSAIFSFSGSWGTWVKKIVVHAEKPNSNHVGLRNVVAYSPELIAKRVVDERRLEPWTAWQELQRETFARRKPIFYLGVLAFVALAAAAARGRRLDQAAIIGLMLIPAFFYPANYYCHYVYLLPLAATTTGPPRRLDEPEGRTMLAWVSALLLLLAFGQTLTLSAEPDVTFTYQSILLLVAVTGILIPMAREAWGLPPFGGGAAGKPERGRGKKGPKDRARSAEGDGGEERAAPEPEAKPEAKPEGGGGEGGGDGGGEGTR
jgi:hypothetical protein